MGWRPRTEKWAADPRGAFRKIRIARRGVGGGLGVAGGTPPRAWSARYLSDSATDRLTF